ncbi:MAG: hypothetical protein KF861_10210 [Planctomycetaceae bacterium]|nr:hypothetical protein [Planctomycetaceae bacterium]
MTNVPFPLPFTPFEFYYWCDDRPTSPTTFPIDLQLRGVLDRTAFDDAVRLTVGRHPLLNALAHAHASRVPQWVEAGEFALTSDWNVEAAPLRPTPTDFVDLAAHPGLRVWIRTGDQQTRVVLQFHHACCDALGALQFVEELLLVYDALIRKAAWNEKLAALEPLRLTQRGDYGLSAAQYRPNIKDVLVMARIWSTTLLRRADPVAVPSSSAPATTSTAEVRPFLTKVLAAEDMQRLQAVARQCSASVNDMMLRDLFLVLREWNAECGRNRRTRLTVNVPVSLRSRAEEGMPAANSLGFWFVHRNGGACTDPPALLASIRDEMASVKKWRLPLFFVGGLGIAMRTPGLMRCLLASKRSFATAVFSNVGRVFSQTPLKRDNGRLICGNVVLEQIAGVPPLRPGTRVAIVVSTYAEETTISLRSDPKYFTPATTADFLDRFVRQLIQSSQAECV